MRKRLILAVSMLASLSLTACVPAVKATTAVSVSKTAEATIETESVAEDLQKELKDGIANVEAMLELASASEFVDFDGSVVVGQRVLSVLQAVEGRNVAILFNVDNVIYNYNAELEGFDETTGIVSDMLDLANGVYKPKKFNIVDGNIQFNSPEDLASGKLGAVEVNPSAPYFSELYKGDTGEVHGIVFMLKK